MKRIISLFLALALVLCACGKKTENTATWQEQYDLGVRYLTEGNYEEAILAFEAAIEIDPKQADAYIALAEVYTSQGDTEKAAEILEQAVDIIGETDELTAALAGLSAPPELKLSNVFYNFSESGDVTGLNPGAVGELEVCFVAPSNINFAEANILSYDEMAQSGWWNFWAEGGVPLVQGSNEWGLCIPVFSNDIEADSAIVVFGYNDRNQLVGCRVIGTLGEAVGASGPEMYPEDDFYSLNMMMQQEGALTFGDLPGLFTTPYNQLSGLLEREYAEGGEFTSEQTGGYGIQVDGEYQSVDYTLPVQYCGYLGEGHSYVQASAPVGDSRLLDISIHDPVGSAGWKGIQMGDSFTTVLEKLGLDSALLQDHSDVTVSICTKQEMNNIWSSNEGDGESPARYITVLFYNAEDTFRDYDYLVYLVFEDGEHLNFVSYSNFSLLVELTS